jgi:hypothetical protein
LNFKSPLLTIDALFSKNSCTTCVYNQVINLKQIFDWKIQDYVIHNEHLNTMYLIKNYHCDSTNESL